MATTAHSRRIAVLQIVLAVAVPALLGSTLAGAESLMVAPPPDGQGQSYWGVIPAPADSVSARIEQMPIPAWEWPGFVLYRGLALPLLAAKRGLMETVVYLDERRVIQHLRALIGPRQGPVGIVVQIEAGSLLGLGGGLDLRHEQLGGPGRELNANWSWTSTGTQKGFVNFSREGGENLRLVIASAYAKRPNARYFGIGADSEAGLRSFYTQELGWGGASVTRRLPRGLGVEAAALYSSVVAYGPGDAEDISVSEQFPLAIPPGFGSRSRGYTLSLALTHDTTEETGRPLAGGMQTLQLSRFIEGGDVGDDFWTVRAEAQHFVGLWNSKQALALRGKISWIDAEDQLQLPFQRLLTNDDPDLFRGYRDFRWRDRGLATLNLEYRWPIWANRDADDLGLDAYLFTDVGQVFHEFGDIGDDFTHSFGGGVRLVGYFGFAGRLEIGRSDEETVFRLRADQIFQYAKGGLSHGRDQAALR